MEINFCYASEYFTLDKYQMSLLEEWCKVMFIPTRTKCCTLDSYAYKHIAENCLGFYVSNADMKSAMFHAGLVPFESDVDCMNWGFYVSKKSPALNFLHERNFGNALKKYAPFIYQGNDAQKLSSYDLFSMEGYGDNGKTE